MSRSNSNINLDVEQIQTLLDKFYKKTYKINPENQIISEPKCKQKPKKP